MTFPISPVDSLFPVAVVHETPNTPARQHAHDEANRRRQEQQAHPEPAEEPPATTAPADPESQPTAGWLLDVKV